jgi:hypothetical protein
MSPTVMTPRKGLLSLGEKLAARFGLSHLWEGNDGLRAILDESLTVAGVPEQISLTPRAVLKRAGVLPKKKRRAKK